MSENKDFDFMKELFDKDGLQTPESLSAEEMKTKILAAKQSENAGEETGGAANGAKPRRRYVWGSIGAAAACVVAVVVAGNTVMRPLGNFFAGSEAAQYGELAAGEAQEDPGDTGTDSGTAAAGMEGTVDAETGMISFSSYAQLKGMVSRMVPEEEEIIDYETDVYDGGPGFGWFAGNGAAASKDAEVAAEEAAGAEASYSAGADTMDGAGADTMDGAGADTMDGAGAGGASSDTYTQVQGVDEADIVKTDGKYIYYTDAYNDAIYIVEANNGETKPVGMVEVRADEPVINDFYLYKDTLISIGYEWDKKADGQKTIAVIYDISDRENPQKINEYEQSGYVISSRMVGANLYLVTDYWFSYYGDDRYIPYVTGENGYEKMDIADICAFPDQETPEYVIAGSVDVTSGDHLKTKAKAVLGGSETIYCNTENLFVGGYNAGYYGGYDDVIEDETYYLEDGTEISGGDVSDTAMPQNGTRILKVSLNDGAPRFEASAIVEGYIDNQFAMDEKDGYLRVATTSTDAHGYDINNLLVLDADLKQVGKVTGFAKNEHVEAVRYIGEKAYVITYEQTDPLFVIDVSDPENPQIEGSVKIDGFSTLLVPADENTLFGIGYATATTKFGEVQEGLKLVSFDISNPSLPKVNDAKEFIGADSEVQYNHKALVHNPQEDYYAIPYNQYDGDYYFEHGGVLVVQIKNGKIKVIKDYQETTEMMRRCVYIGDYIYTIDEENEVGSFKMR